MFSLYGEIVSTFWSSDSVLTCSYFGEHKTGVKDGDTFSSELASVLILSKFGNKLKGSSNGGIILGRIGLWQVYEFRLKFAIG